MSDGERAQQDYSELHQSKTIKIFRNHVSDSESAQLLVDYSELIQSKTIKAKPQPQEIFRNHG